jgi:hypothetical protein
VASAVATDAAHRVAESGDRTAAGELIRRWLGHDAVVRWRVGDGQVRIDVEVPAPAVPGLDATIHRGATVRREIAP